MTSETKRMLENRRKIQTVACPSCGATAGERCKAPSGFAVAVPHQARRRAAADARVYVP